MGQRVRVDFQRGLGSNSIMRHSFWTIACALSLWLILIAVPARSEPSLVTKSPPQFSGLLESGPSAGDNGDSHAGLSASLSARAQAMEKLSPAGRSDFLIGAEDVLDISVWRNVDLSKTVQVRPDGRISLPVVRDIVAVGKTPVQLAEEITARLREYVQNPVVAISVKEVNSYNVFLLGEVAKPGRYPLKSRTSLLQGLTMAGGFTTAAARNQVVVFRIERNGEGEQLLRASYDEIVLGSGAGQNIELKPGDTIVVPSEAMVVFPGLNHSEELPPRQ